MQDGCRFRDDVVRAIMLGKLEAFENASHQKLLREQAQELRQARAYYLQSGPHHGLNLEWLDTEFAHASTRTASLQLFTIKGLAYRRRYNVICMDRGGKIWNVPVQIVLDTMARRAAHEASVAAKKAVAV
jgi:hypothetical protein